jgi:hypothetical protein
VSGYVYFIKNPATSAIKIGYSLCPHKRIQSLQTGSSAGLELLHYCTGSPMLERNIHGLLAHERLEGEWFRGNYTDRFFRSTVLCGVSYAVAELAATNETLSGDFERERLRGEQLRILMDTAATYAIRELFNGKTLCDIGNDLKNQFKLSKRLRRAVLGDVRRQMMEGVAND